MEKRKLFGNGLKEQLLASARDRAYRFLMAGGTVRGVIVHGTRMINEMRANHELGILETMVLGRAYLGVCLMTAEMKGIDRIALKIACSGPIAGLVAEGNAFGEIRGYLYQVPIPVERPLNDFDLLSFFGAGVVSVTHHMTGAKDPFTGQVALKYGNIALDLANYYLESEQIPTAINLSIQLNRKGDVIGAGGLMLQVMPNVDEGIVPGLESDVSDMPSLGKAFAEEKDPQEIVNSHFRAYEPRFIGDRRIEFLCHCSREKLKRFLSLMPANELEDILENGPFPLEVRCHNCNTPYEFNQYQIGNIYEKRMAGRSQRR